MSHQKRLMQILTAMDTIWKIVSLAASPHWTSQSSYEAVASLLTALSVWAVLMSLYSIATNYNGPLEAAHANNDDDRYDKVN